MTKPSLYCIHDVLADVYCEKCVVQDTCDKCPHLMRHHDVAGDCMWDDHDPIRQMDNLVEELLAQVPALVTHQELADYKQRGRRLIATPTLQPTMGVEKLREQIRLLYIASEKETDIPVTKFLDATMTLITQATERAEVEGALKSLDTIWDDYAPGNLKSPIIKALAAHIELLKQRLHTLSKADHE